LLLPLPFSRLLERSVPSSSSSLRGLLLWMAWCCFRFPYKSIKISIAVGRNNRAVSLFLFLVIITQINQKKLGDFTSTFIYNRTRWKHFCLCQFTFTVPNFVGSENSGIYRIRASKPSVTKTIVYRSMLANIYCPHYVQFEDFTHGYSTVSAFFRHVITSRLVIWIDLLIM
jgi:hypothetical protein